MSTKQRGSGWSIKFAFNLYKIFGYKFIYYIMYPVSFFYFIFSSEIKTSLKIYYYQLNIPFSNKQYYKHLRMFAICMVDRFISKHDPNSYIFINKNLKSNTEILNKKSILLFSHFGGWSSIMNKPILNNTINIVMKEVLLDKIKEIEDSMTSKNTNTRIIDLSMGAIPVSIKIANALSNNEIIAMMVDRPTDKKYVYKTKFFQDQGNFNKNPFQIAYKTKTPILAIFAINTGIQIYEIKATLLNMNYQLNEYDAIDITIKEYTNLFKDILVKNPEQWFNFYNFWEKK